MARNGIWLLFALMIGTALWGCPYDSDTPLSPPEKAAIDRALPGTWELEKPPDSPGLLKILPFNDHELLIIVQEKESRELYRAFTTTIDGEKFLNLRQIGETTPGAAGPWNFVNYSTAGDRLTYRIVEDTVPEREKLSREAFIARIEKDPGNRELYDEDSGGVLVRTHSLK